MYHPSWSQSTGIVMFCTSRNLVLKGDWQTFLKCEGCGADKTGIRHPNGEACCPSSCGEYCGASNCRDKSDDCCGSIIMSSGHSCATSNAPCMITGCGADKTGIRHPNGEACCPSSCGEYCGASNCRYKSDDCCGSIIK